MTTFSRFLTKLLGFFFRNITFFLFSFGLSNPFLPLIVWLLLLLLIPALEFDLFITNVSFTFFISLSCGDNSFRPGFSIGDTFLFSCEASEDVGDFLRENSVEDVFESG